MQHGNQSIVLSALGFVVSLRKSRKELFKLKQSQKNTKLRLKFFEKLLDDKQADLDEANMEIFYLKCGSKKIHELMVFINEKIVKCECMACYETGRTQESPHRQTEDYVCSFSSSWEEILEMYEINFKFHRIPDDSDEVEFMKDISNRETGPRMMHDTDIVNVGHDEHWRNVALGRRVARGGDPFTEARNNLRHLLELPKDYRIPVAVPDEVVPDSMDDEVVPNSIEGEDPDNDETQSPVFDLTAPAARRPGTGPVALGRGNARV